MLPRLDRAKGCRLLVEHHVVDAQLVQHAEHFGPAVCDERIREEVPVSDDDAKLNFILAVRDHVFFTSNVTRFTQ